MESTELPEHEKLEKLLLKLYPMMIPFANLAYSEFKKKCKEMYDSFALRDEFTFTQYIEQMLLRATKREEVYK